MKINLLTAEDGHYYTCLDLHSYVTTAHYRCHSRMEQAINNFISYQTIIARTPTFWIYSPTPPTPQPPPPHTHTNSIEIYKKVERMDSGRADIQSHEKSWPQGYLYQTFLNAIKKNYSYSPDTEQSWPRSWVDWKMVKSMHKVSWHTKFEGSNWISDFSNVKYAQVTWSAIIRISKEVRCWYSISSKILTKMIYIPTIIEIQWKQFKLSSVQQTLMSEHPGSLR